MYKIDLYASANGHSEIQDFLNTLKSSHDPFDQSLFQKISYQIELLANLGQ